MRKVALPLLVLLAVAAMPPVQAQEKPKADLAAVLVYPTAPDGSIMDWLSISPLYYNISFLGDSMSADALAVNGQTELTSRPRAGDQVQGQRWHKMHWSGCVQGPTVCELFQTSGGYFEYGLTPCLAYVYSPVDRPNAVLSGMR